MPAAERHPVEWAGLVQLLQRGIVSGADAHDLFHRLETTFDACGALLGQHVTFNAWNITTNVTAAGEIDVSFWYTSGANKLSITSAALLVNGVQVDIDTHAGTAESTSTYEGAEPYIPVFTLYVLHLPETKPGATYTIQAVVAGSGGTATSGTVYLANWN